MIFNIRKIGKKISTALIAALLSGAIAGCASFGENGTQAESQSADQGGSTEQNSAQDGVLSDGEYLPDDFTFSGGSGKVKIACTRVEIADGGAYADIVFSSENYSEVKAGGETFSSEKGDGTSLFTIPVTLNEEETITGTTTAMSQPHDVDYTICVYLDADSAQPYSAEASQAILDAAFESDEEDKDTSEASAAEPPQIPGLTYKSELELQYAEGFHVYYYSDDHEVIAVEEGGTYLTIPEGGEVPEGLDESITVIHKPLDNIYLAASATMAFFNAIDAIGNISFSVNEADYWYIENARTAMENGEIVYAGKYSEPDYEMLIDGECDLAVESSMILHAPEVQEMLESLGIPVFMDRSSYEDHPLGRTEWIKVYAVLMDKEEEAQAFFDEQIEKVSEAENYEKSDAEAAFFYINSDGAVVVRNTTDYIVKMIEMAGGNYIYTEPPGETSGSNVTITMEEFYNEALEADYLIYNSSISGEIGSIDELIKLNALFADFKAVKEGNVWTTNKLLYQATDSLADFIIDVHGMLNGEDDSGMSFLIKLD